PAPPTTPPAETREEAEIRSNLAQLGKDRALAEEQKFCPITGERLATPAMGAPGRVMVKGRPVCLCCDGCRDQALADPDQTRAKVEELKAKAKAGPEGGH